MRLKRLLSLLLLVPSLSFAFSSAPPQEHLKDAETVKAQDTNPITNFHEVVPGALYRGARPDDDGSGLKYLKGIGIKTVIDLQGGDLNSPLAPIIGLVEPGERSDEILEEQKTAQDLGLAFYNESMDSLDPVDAAEAVRIEAALKIMHDPAQQPVYVHCQHGADRTGLVVALYRVRFQGWTVDQAHQEMIAMGHDSFHQTFTGDMDKYLYAAAQSCTLCPAP